MTLGTGTWGGGPTVPPAALELPWREKQAPVHLEAPSLVQRVEVLLLCANELPKGTCKGQGLGVMTKDLIQELLLWMSCEAHQAWISNQSKSKHYIAHF